MTFDRVRRPAPMLAVLVAALVAFVASAISMLPAHAAAKKTGASIETARLARVQAAKPIPRTADSDPGTAATPRVPAPLAAHRAPAASPPSASWSPPAKARAELMVFLI